MRYPVRSVNIRLTHLRKLAGEHGIIIASRVMRQHAPAMREAGSASVGQAQLSVYPLGFIGIKPLSRLSVCRESDKSDQALGGVGPIRFSHLLGGTGKGWQRRRHRPSELCSALGRHLPGQERAEVRGALAAMVGTGL